MMVNGVRIGVKNNLLCLTPLPTPSYYI